MRGRLFRAFTLGGLLFWLTSMWGDGPGAAELAELTGFGANPGNLRMWTYVPDDLPPSPALVVALHGCFQLATDFDDETGWTYYADLLGFALLLPEQKRGFWRGNHPLGCFNWYYQGDQSRGNGEAASIIQMVRKMLLDHDIDPARVYVAGLSAGGAMTAALLAAYPDYFAGGAIIAGIPYRCSSVPDYVPQWAVPYWGTWLGYTNPARCLNPGVDLVPQHWGQRVRKATADALDRWPRVSIWHGTADRTVAPRNALELVEQWTDVHGADRAQVTTETVHGHLRRRFHNAAGEPVVELYLIAGAGHGTPIDPAEDSAARTLKQCGIADDFALPANICSSYFIAEFWGLTHQPPRD